VTAERYFIAEQPAPAPHLASPEGRAALAHMPVTGLSPEGPGAGGGRARLGIVKSAALNVIRKEAWLFCRTIFGVRLCWELENLEDLKDGSVDRDGPRLVGVGGIPEHVLEPRCLIKGRGFRF